MDSVSHSTFRRVGIVLLVLTLIVLLLPSGAGAKGKGGKGKGGSKALLPPKGKIFAGISDTGQTRDFEEYRKQTAAHPAVMQSFESWGYFPQEAVDRWKATRTRGMISLSTGACYKCDPIISAKSISEGKGDRYLLTLSRGLEKYGEPVYIRLFPEMNGYWNAYCAFRSDGRHRKPSHSTRNFKQAWKRVVLIVRGGKAKTVNKQLKKLGMPTIQAKSKKKLPQPKVSFAWVPQSTGSPNVPGNHYSNYWPGYKYVDWAGADIYSKFPNFAGMNELYKRYKKVPFMIGEWAPWDADDAGFVKQLTKWVRKHGRTKISVYYQGFGEGKENEFELKQYPKARVTLRKQLNDKRYAQFAPENEKKKSKGKKNKKAKGKKKGR